MASPGNHSNHINHLLNPLQRSAHDTPTLGSILVPQLHPYDFPLQSAFQLSRRTSEPFPQLTVNTTDLTRRADDPFVLAPAPALFPSLLFPTPSPSTASQSLFPTRNNSPEVHRARVPIQNSMVALHEAHSLGLLSARADSGSWEVQCPDCEQWISSGIKATYAFGSTPGHFNTLESHRNSRKRCSLTHFTAHSANSLLQTWRASSNGDQASRTRSLTVPLPESAHIEPIISPQSGEQDAPHETTFPSMRRQRSSSEPVESNPSATVSLGECPGVEVHWPSDELGSFNDTFPWSRIGDEPKSLPFIVTIDRDGKHFAFSKACSRKSIGINQPEPCIACSDIPRRIDRLIGFARQGNKFTAHSYLSTYQLRDLLADRNAEINRYKLRMLNMARKIGTATQKAADYRRFVMAIAEKNVSRVQVIVQTALRNGAGISAIIRKIESAFEGLYHPTNFTTSDMDLSTLIYRMGGRALLYAMSQCSGLPSLRTLRNHTVFTRVMPTVGHITQKEIDHNIREVVIKALEDKNTTSSPQASVTPRGMSLLIDEVALEESAVHFRHTNSVGGLCWKHSNAVDLILRTFQSAVSIAQGLADGSVHMGKEMTVASLSFFGLDGTFPVLAAPTCKQETAEDMQFILELILKTWKESPGIVYGAIWSVATDGDSTRRACGFNMFLKHRLSTASPLYGTLSNMPGLNLYTGDDEITLDFDYKHIFKRICTLIRSPNGITLNGGRIVTSVILERYLVMFKGETVENAKRLLNPEDPQDVPRAIELMQAVISLGACDIGETSHPSVVADMDAIRYLAALLDAILEPFINVSLSLQEQVIRLSKFAHLSFACFRLYRLSFMSNQLYFDSQTMVKNMMFCIAKQQRLDPTSTFFAFETGDDRLEKLFGRIRMLGAHDSGMNFRQGVERLGHAMDIDRVFLRRPDLDIGHRRLSTSRKEGVDHINATAWQGDASVYQCHLPLAWAQGREAAQAVLRESQMAPACSAFLDIFSDDSIDMLRPFGQGIYPGLRSEQDDRSIDILLPSAPAPSSNIADEELGITLEDAIEEIPELALKPAKGVCPDDYLSWNGKPVHKMSICRLVITPDYMQKSNNRPERVRGYKKFKANGLADLNSDDITGPQTFIVGDRVVALVRSSRTLSLAVIQSSSIREGATVRTSIPIATIMNPKAAVRIEGQIMVMRMVPTTLDSADVDISAKEAVPSTSAGPHTENEDSPEDSPDSESPWSWVWNGALIMGDGSMRGATERVVTERALKISIPGHLTRVVNADIVFARDRIAEGDLQYLNSKGTSWSLQDGFLGALSLELWEATLTAGIPLASLPTVEDSENFPYRHALDDEKFGLVCNPGTMRLAQDPGLNKDVARDCHFCGELVSGPADHWRGHIGRHILHQMRETGLFLPSSTAPPVGTSMPCGFCGLSGNPSCQINLSVTARKMSVECNCPHTTKMILGWANKGTAAVPCRNAPIICPLCTHPASFADSVHPATWRYNMPEHIRTQHPEYASPGNPVGLLLPEKLWDDMKIMPKEELLMGIPPEKIPPPFQQVLWAANDVEGSNAGSSTAGRKRGTSSRAGEPVTKRGRRSHTSN